MDVHNGQREMIEFYTAEGSSPIGIYRRMRIVYGEYTIDVGSDAGCVGLRAAKRILLVTGHATADQPRQRRRSGVLREKFYNQFRAICIDVK